ncbi:MAG: pseudouridine synthase [Sediminicola sp.]
MGRSDDNRDGKASGRGEGGFKKKSYARGNSPIKKNTEPGKKPSDPNLIRLNKYVANSGVCSRRDADIYISSGNVTVNGKPVTEMGHKVRPGDIVKFDGRLLNPEKKEYVLLNKPKDFSMLATDEKGKRSAMQLVINASKSKISPIGHLDKSDMGLVLFTNDGEMAKRLARPQNGLRKIYHVVLDKNLKFEDLKAIQEGITIEENLIRVADISYIDDAPKREVGIEIHSTRNKAVQKIFEHLGYVVEKLDRVVFAGLTKKDLPRGHWRYLTEQEIINLGMIK